MPNSNLDDLTSRLPSLKFSAALLFGSLVIVHLVFAYYIGAFYALSALTGEISQWNTRLFHGLIEGDQLGNVAVILHIFLSLVFAISGPVQLVPKLRQCFPRLHRWNGRLYIVAALVSSTSGIFMLATRGGVTAIGDLSLGLNGVLIIWFALMAWRCAVGKNFLAHRRWALRLFFVSAGFLFGRLGFQLWSFFFGDFARSPAFDGPFDILWGFGMYLVPLAFVELYLRLEATRKPAPGKAVFSSSLLIIAALILFGGALAFTNLWLPYL
jgi:uncharacterized membrane protein